MKAKDTTEVDEILADSAGDRDQEEEEKVSKRSRGPVNFLLSKMMEKC